jgi:hypothetical protein
LASSPCLFYFFSLLINLITFLVLRTDIADLRVANDLATTKLRTDVTNLYRKFDETSGDLYRKFDETSGDLYKKIDKSSGEFLQLLRDETHFYEKRLVKVAEQATFTQSGKCTFFAVSYKEKSFVVTARHCLENETASKDAPDIALVLPSDFPELDGGSTQVA